MIGLLGGTFDPIHAAHIRVALAAASQCGLAEVFLIPASDPPHRAAGAIAPYEDRIRMVEIACEGHPVLVPSRLEQRAGKSYSIDTVEALHAEPRFHGVPLYFIIGADAFADIQTWRDWRRLADLVIFAVVDRPGASYEIPPGARVHTVKGLQLAVSSSAIRASLDQGSADLPPGVLDYIREHRLYGYSTK